jgi:hypothetical protein
MPLLAGPQFVITPGEPVGSGPTTAYLETVGKPTFTWFDPDGGIWPLSNTSENLGWFTLTGPAGTEAATIEITTDTRPRGGERVRAIADKPMVIQWPLEIFGRNHDEFIERYRTISRAFKLTTRRQRPGVLRVQRPSGSIREIEAFYSEGLSGEAGQNHLFARPVITLFCPDGKWRDPTALVLERTFAPAAGGGEPVITYFDPYLSITSSSVLGSDPIDEDDPASLTSINNPGDVEAWPVWTVTGPLTELRAWNVTRDTRFVLTYTLTAGQTLTIDTGAGLVRGPAQQNLSKYIQWFDPEGAELWPLSDGTNVIGLQVDGAGTGTAVRLEFSPRYDNS